VLVFVTLTLAALVGMMGLVVDYGSSTMDVRMLRNATDAAAISGVIAMVDDPTTTNTSVTTSLGRNQAPAGTTTACAYVDTSGATLEASCAGTPPSTASGIKVSATATRSTYFMGILGQPTVTVGAASTARAWAESVYNVGASLFIVCGYGTTLASSGSTNILQGTQPGSSPWPVNLSAVGQTFRIHDQSKVSRCGAGTEFKGLNGTTGNVTLPTNLVYTTGEVTSVQVTVPALNGCQANTSVTNCVMIIPIAVDLGSGAKQLYAVRFLPFWVTQSGNGHDARLLGTSYVVSTSGQGTSPWTVGTQSGPVSVHLAD
jgi:putative Flp pilus-assembly TadE/G-like protein